MRMAATMFKTAALFFIALLLSTSYILKTSARSLNRSIPVQPQLSQSGQSSTSGNHHAQQGLLATYWGQFDSEGSLEHICNTGSYDIVMISFLDVFGNGKKLGVNLAGHCDPSGDGCLGLSKDITSCQSNGVKVMLSIGGASGDYGLVSTSDAQQVAQSIWDDYLGGSGSSRPLGDAVLEGVDFDIETGGSDFYGDLATALRELMDSNSDASPSGQFFLGAAPQCPFQDQFLGPGDGTALESGLFDFVWIQFYNNPDCQYDSQQGTLDNLLKSWKQWTDALPSSKIYMGLPASPDAATGQFDLTTGFIPSDILRSDVLPQIKNSPNYGGVMIWSAFYDLQNPASGTSLSSTLKDNL